MSKKTTQRARIATLEEHAAESRAQPPRKPEPPLKGRTLTKAEYEARVKKASKRKLPSERLAAVPPTTPDVDAKAEAAAPAAPTAAPKPKATKDAPTARKPGGLDAAAQVLAQAKEPLSCKDLVERMLAQGLWQTNGKTPAATIYSAILREIMTRGDAARFRKADRGRFTLAG